MSRVIKKLSALATIKEDLWESGNKLGEFIYIPGFPVIYHAEVYGPGYYDNRKELVDNTLPSKTLEQLIKKMMKARKTREKQSG